jgi:hypothetical protein
MGNNLFASAKDAMVSELACLTSGSLVQDTMGKSIKNKAIRRFDGAILQRVLLKRIMQLVTVLLTIAWSLKIGLQTIYSGILHK